jgi:hypothetical protein
VARGGALGEVQRIGQRREDLREAGGLGGGERRHHSSTNWSDLFGSGRLKRYIPLVMLRRLSRPFAALFALWFTLVLGDPWVLHNCPMHSGHDMSAAAAGTGGASMDHSSHGRTAAASADEGAPADEANNVCTCMGGCTATVAPSPLPTLPTFVVPAHVAENVGYPEYRGGAGRASLDVRLPYANAPPQA